jgi:glycosyltransferase involved in cell wall biosynthesis
MTKPKVWMITPSFFPTLGGAESQVQRVSMLLLFDGWCVRVLTRQHNWAYPKGLPGGDLIVNDIPVTRLYSRGGTKVGSLLYVLGGLWYMLRLGRGDIYHAHDIGAAGWLAVAVRYLLGGRCLIKLRTGRNLYDELFSSRFARWSFCTLLRLADRIVVTNREVERFVHGLGIPNRRIVYLPNAVDTNVFHPVSAGRKLAVRERLGLPSEKDIVLYIGRLHPLKGVDVLLCAWALLPEGIRQRAMLLVIGDGSERDNLLRMSASLGIEDTVVLAGRQETTRDYYWASDLFVMPSRSEGQSNALNEAMACGLPVIASNVGGTLDVVEEGKSGVLFESENDRQLAEKLSSLLTARERWTELGTHARLAILQYADLGDTVTRLKEIYLELGDCDL